MNKHDKDKFYELYRAARQAYKNNNSSEAINLLEHAHFAGVFNTKTHVIAHWGKMLLYKHQKKFFRLLLESFFLLAAFLTPLTRFCHRIGFFLPIHPDTKYAFDREYQRAQEMVGIGDYGNALYHLGRAHILGNHFAFFHFRTHFLMLKIEIYRVNVRGIVIQSLRSFGALFTRFLVHRFGVTGNPGHSEFPIGTRLPLAKDLVQPLEKSLVHAFMPKKSFSVGVHKSLKNREKNY